MARSSRRNAHRPALAVGAFALVGMASTGCQISFGDDRPAANQGGTSSAGNSWGSQGGGNASGNSTHSPMPASGNPYGSYGITVGAGVTPSSIYEATCGTPRKVTLVGTIRVTHGPVTVRYQWFDSATGAYSPPASLTFQGPGARTVSDQWRLSRAGMYGAALKVLSPYAVQSGRSTVTYRCSGSTQTGNVKVPVLKNATKDAAISRLSALGLKYTVVHVIGHGYPDTISHTSPEAYTEVTKGSVVTLYVYKEEGAGNEAPPVNPTEQPAG